MIRFCTFILAFVAMSLLTCRSTASDLERLKFSNPGLVVDLGAGLWAWPLPMDCDGDGDADSGRLPVIDINAVRKTGLQFVGSHLRILRHLRHLRITLGP